MPNKSHKAVEAVSVTKLTHINDHTFTITVKIEDFKKKMKTWPSNNFLMSESFTVDAVPMSFEIYPNGDEDEGYVSVYLINDSNAKIQVDFILKMKGCEVRLSGVDLKPDEGYGLYGSQYLYCHKSVADVGSDEDTKINCTIHGFRKYVSDIESREKDSTNDLKRKYDSIESKVEEGNSNIEKRIAGLESKLEAASESIKAKIDVSAAKNNNSVVRPKCPICFEEMSTKIAQCISGHLLCWPCKEKMGDRECAFCDQPVNGRAHGMEAYLRTIFG